MISYNHCDPHAPGSVLLFSCGVDNSTSKWAHNGLISRFQLCILDINTLTIY